MWASSASRDATPPLSPCCRVGKAHFECQHVQRPCRCPGSISAKPGQARTDKYYDQIAWFAEIHGAGGLSMDYRGGGFVDFLPYVYTNTGLTRNEISWRVSDHDPLWAELAI